MHTEVPLEDVFVIYVGDDLLAEDDLCLQRNRVTCQASVVRCHHGNHEARSVMVGDGTEVDA